ncbi:NADH-ubiquinone oxidoreductase-F iron-sulfur binding region domain-containing protein [Roseibium aestuarii]|uniref:NADH-ubiquinone oxidoreductase-F iron-sulfur binding region domain-containing protein n=1 Tax=Roseibium aestuarii TaxID=2600299 RepID=A0ABW4JW00_9HYPH|nr:NADH-ubiquinone oxidoreductase-F iron-sulfur binding region domain-containing protein [Roseibium aestuarii]
MATKHNRPAPKRQPQPTPAEIITVEEAVARLGTSRDALLETLLNIRDAHGGVSEAALLYVARLLRLSPAEAYEVATASPAVNYEVTSRRQAGDVCCDSVVCVMLRGTDSGDHAFCKGHCRIAATSQPRSFDAFRKAGGYTTVEQLLMFPASREEILDRVANSRIVGRAGVGYPVYQKWQNLMAAGGDPVVIVNANEGEIATFKDRTILESDPHAVLEAALVAALITGARTIFFYLKDDYSHLHPVLLNAIDAVARAAIAPDICIHLRRSGGAYICGEETALISSLEGYPARPRERPPFPTDHGYMGRPTLVHNVETFYRLRAAWGARMEPDIAVSGLLDPTATLFSVSGRVRRPGPVLVSGMQQPLATLLDAAGGLEDGHELGGMVIGGSAGTIIRSHQCFVRLADLIANGLRLGTGSVIVFGANDDKRWIAAQMASFLARENCGQCSPCRIGSQMSARALADGQLDGLDDLASAMSEASICGLGKSAGRFLAGVLPLLRENH